MQAINSLKLPQIDLANGLMTEEHIKDSVSGSDFKADGITREGIAHLQDFSFKVDLSFLLHFAHQDPRIILDGRQALWKRAQAYLVARGRHLKSQGVMRTNEIVLVSEGVKGSLEIENVLPLPSHEELSDKRAVKPFIFAHGLRVVRSAVTHRDPQAHQPHRQPGVRMGQIPAPGAAVVHNHRVGKPVETKGFGQRWLYRLSGLVRQSFKAQVKARVIVQDSQCLSRATYSGQWPFEIHLPKTIGHLTLETLPVGFGRFATSIDQPVTVKDSGDGARGRQSFFTLIVQKTADLARSPARITTTQRYQRLFFCLGQLTGSFLGTTRMIGETFTSLFTVSAQPLVAGLPTDAVTLAQLRKAHRFFLRQSHKLLAQRHETNHSPRHKLSPLSLSGRTMPLVTEKVLPMSPVHLLPMSPVYTPFLQRGISATVTFGVLKRICWLKPRAQHPTARCLNAWRTPCRR